MKYADLAEVYSRLEATTKRLEMIDILVKFFQSIPKETIRQVVYLTSGRIAADYVDLELNFADKMVIKAISKALGRSETAVSALFKKSGDLGEVVQKLKSTTTQTNLSSFFQGPTNEPSELTIQEVWDTLHKIASTDGRGSTARKINFLVSLYMKASPVEAKFLTRTVLAQLRLGVKDLTIIEALARAFGEGKKNARKVIEQAYNVSCDIGFVGEILSKGGLAAVKNVGITVGRPIRMMAAQRMSSVEELLEKLGGTCALEFKYDGERVQAHISSEKVQLYSRNLNEISTMYPDVQEGLLESLNAKEIIVEGEITAWDPEGEKLKPFQILMSRKRKHEIQEAMKNIPVKVFLFDILYVDGRSLLAKPYPERRKLLEQHISPNELVTVSSQKVVSSTQAFEEFFETSLAYGCEGIMAKDIREKTPYQTGNRGFLWIKHKFDYTSSFADSFDFVVVGAFYGKGRRKGTFGTLLMAAYNAIEERFETVCKLGSGFTDKDLEKITEELTALKAKTKPKEVNSKLEPDIWVHPSKVFEIQGADLSTSPVHTCALDEIKADTGIAIRFPRFIRYRDDKNPEQATTTKEVITAYKNQRLRST